MFGSGPTAAPNKRARIIEEARRLLSDNKPAEAAAALDPLIKKSKSDPEALFLMALVAEKQRRVHQSVSFAKRSLELMTHPDPMLLLARFHRTMGETDEAVAWCNRVLSLKPRNPPASCIKAAAMEEAGRYDHAEEVLAPLIAEAERAGRLSPAPIREVWARLLVQRKRFDEALKVIDGILAEHDSPDELCRVVLHLKAKACDRAKRYDDAWRAAESANEIGRIDFDPDLYEEQVSTLMEIWSRENMARFPLSECDSELPVFVAGMPRSGTSLIDQIIDAHPKAAGVGELNTLERFAAELGQAYDPSKEPPACFGRYDRYRWTRVAREYVRELQGSAGPGVERVVNKALGNNKLVGLFARLFPKTRVIHAIRDPKDVSISCFMGGFNNRMHPWTTRVDWAARAWEQSMRMMEHWKATLDIPILDVHYERLVHDPETEFPRIIDFLGLEWDDACREFYKSKRTVRTLSYDQVNRPLYTSSAGRHANYDAWLSSVAFPEYGAAV